MAPGHAEPHSWVRRRAGVRPTIVLEANELEVQLSLACYSIDYHAKHTEINDLPPPLVGNL